MRSTFKRVVCSPVFITGFAFALRMLVLYYAALSGRAQVRDFLPYGYELGRVARAIAAGEGFSSPLRMVDSGPTIWFTPIYPYLVAGIFKIWGIYSEMSHIIVNTLNCAFAALTIIPIYSIGKRTFGDGVAIGAAWAWVFLPTALFFPMTWVWDTTLAALFFALIFWATLAMREARGILPAAGYGALWAVGVLINPSLLSTFPFLLGWLMWEARKESLPWLRQGSIILVVFAIGLVPWTIRNYRVFDKFVVLRSNFGLELWLGNNPEVPDTWSPWMHPNDSPAEAEKYKRMGEIAYMAQKQSEAVEFMRTHPRDTLYFMYRRFVNNWLGITDSPGDSWSRSPLYVRAFLVLNVFLFLFTMLGALYAYRSRLPAAIPYAFVLLIFPLVFYFTHTSLRYRFPMDPIMMVLAANGVGCSISLFQARFRHERSPATPIPSIPVG
jgi:hypothetical protein